MSASVPPPPSPGAPAPTPKPVWKKWWFWVLVVVALLIAAPLVGGGDSEEEAGSPQPTAPELTPEPTEDPAEEPTEEPTEELTENREEPAAAGFEQGAWVVGEEIKPGVYRAADPGGNCYWERLKNFSGSFNAIIANGNATGGPIVVEIKKTDMGFNSDGCGFWSSDLSQISASKEQVGDGIWIVGTDMAPGTYRTNVPGGNCYWARLRSFDGGFNAILANDLPGKGSAIVQIKSSDVGFETQDCGTWEKV